MLEPQEPYTNELCPGDRVVILCNVNGRSLDWKWQESGRIYSFKYTILSSKRIQIITNPVHLNLSEHLQIALIHNNTVEPFYLASSLQYHLLENFQDNWISCNNEIITLTKSKSIIVVS